MQPLALYVHWPFCLSKCPYCDFNSHVRERVTHADWREAYIKELRHFAAQLPNRRVRSIFFGGGTPSLMEPQTVELIINEAASLFGFEDNAEITLEANPTSVEMGKMRDFRVAGVNRVSLGVQSLNQADLTFLGRMHSALDAKKAVAGCAEIFDRYTFDLIYARPGQTLDAWRAELAEALNMMGGHLSLYQLTIEKGTPFYAAFQRHEFALPDEETSIALYDLTAEMLAGKNMRAYEISNYAEPGMESRHNLAYWKYDEYLGIGPGAHSRLKTNEGRQALMMVHAPEAWLKSVAEKNHGLQSSEAIEGEVLLSEFLMMGLRLTEGIDAKRFEQEIGATSEALFGTTLQTMREEGLIELRTDRLIATPRGRMVLGMLTSELISSASQ